MFRSTSLLLMLLLSLVAVPAAAQEDPSPASTREQVEQELADIKTQLTLSDYQWTQVEMILKSSIRERVAIAKRYGLEDGGVEALEGKEKRALKREIKSSRKFAEQRMKRFLSKDQMKEFKALQERIDSRLLEQIEP